MAEFYCDLNPGEVRREAEGLVLSVSADTGRVGVVTTSSYYANGEWYHGWPIMHVFETDDLRPAGSGERSDEVEQQVKDNPECMALVDRIIAGHNHYWDGQNRIGTLTPDAAAAAADLVARINALTAALPDTWEDVKGGMVLTLTVGEDGATEILDLQPLPGRTLLLCDDCGGRTGDCPDWRGGVTKLKELLDAAGIAYDSGEWEPWEGEWLTVADADLDAAREVCYSQRLEL